MTTSPQTSAPVSAPASTRTRINLRVRRQADPASQPYWEDYSLPYRPNMNVISVLMERRGNPTTADGKKAMPISWDAACLEEVCSSCSMVINGIPRQACSCLVDKLE